MLLDFRHPQTLQTQNGKLRFAIISCMNDHITDPQETMWQGVVAHKPDVMFWIGDEVYADILAMGKKDANPQQLWERYVETRHRLPIFYTAELIPTFTIWDDHDTGKGDADYS